MNFIFLYLQTIKKKRGKITRLPTSTILDKLQIHFNFPSIKKNQTQKSKEEEE